MDGDETGVDCGGSYLSGSSYRINPPSSCFNRFGLDGCEKGDATSACGGRFQVANACRPPEDSGKADLPMTFLCPRFMLFNREMETAANDDTEMYVWGKSAEPSFVYGAVDHGAETSGLDRGLESTFFDDPSLWWNLSSWQLHVRRFPEPVPTSSWNQAYEPGRL